MGIKIPTTQELADQNLTGLESSLGQTSPVAEKAFLRVLAVVESMMHTGLYKMAVERIKQNLAQTATGVDLDMLGGEVSTYRKSAETARLTVTLPAQTGIIIPATAGFIGVANGIRYSVLSPAVASSNIATISVAAESAGVVGNLQTNDTMTLISPIAGADNIATVTVVENTGAEEETDAAYRLRVLFAMWATTGGGNATDHKIWAEEVAGVYRAFPFAGKPVGGGTSYPGDRTVYIESDTSININGVPTVGLLAEVRAAINTNPATGKSRPTLGQTNDTLYVEAITRSSINLTITNLITPSGQEASVKDAISAAVTAYMLTLACYVEGVDLEQSRNDRVTTPAVSEVVQQVIGSMGASASSVVFSVGATPYSTYALTAGELAKLGTITYATV